MLSGRRKNRCQQWARRTRERQLCPFMGELRRSRCAAAFGCDKGQLRSPIQFNDNTLERELFYRAVSAVLEIVIDDELELSDYLFNLKRLYGDQTMDAVVGSVKGDVRFYGLTPTNMQLAGLDKNLRLIKSYKKLHAAYAARV
ncbi:hypothetical protein R0135_05920 [Congregibacter variabilis]|uniref:YcaO cyclodehydratase C-terminal domain-containing protein n=1 Tax=Congregibacter variabilis TaxID=3081200 RepID=A0ABZ0I598_9GAMM|nr:hypothetical protein R0135_05920 [Congregibacter sp. IMCC43200]